MPAEWEPQGAVQITFPHPKGDWGVHFDEVLDAYVGLAQAAAVYAPLLLVCSDLPATRALFPADIRHRIQFFELASNDSWARDHGGLIVYEQGRPLLLDFTFNGWGLKFPADLDNLITRRLYAAGAFRVDRLEQPPLVLEGGSLDTDGGGTALVTSSCLLSPHRNPHLDRRGIEACLAEQLGLDRILWLEHGALLGDDTDGHIDTLARFCSPEAMAYVRCTDREDPHFEPLARMEAQLRGFRQRRGAPYRLHPLPLPDPVRDAEGRRLPATYANFLILNGAVLMPTYGVPQDAEARRVLQAAFPGHAIRGVPSRPLLRQGGSLHCATMQYPAGTVAVFEPRAHG